MICSNCGEEFVGNFCPRCGKAVFADQDKTKCPNCGIEFNGNFCPNCGHPKSTDISHINSLPPTNEQPEYENLQNTQPPISITINNSNSGSPSASTAHSPSAKNKWVAFLLCLFLGFLGIHKFYERKILMGILYLFTCGLFGIGIVVDLIVLLFKPNPYYV